MSWWRRHIGLDPFAVGLQAVITALILFWIGAENNPRDAVALMSMAGVISLLVLDVRRRVALRRQEQSELPPAMERLAELEQRVAELEQDAVRLAELEERLDFAERLLARAGSERPELLRGERP
jgi:cell shape-determining protein MreC